MKSFVRVPQVQLSNKAQTGLMAIGTSAYFAGVATCAIKGAAAPVLAKAVVVAGIGVAAGMAGNAIYKSYKRRQLDAANFAIKANIITVKSI